MIEAIENCFCDLSILKQGATVFDLGALNGLFASELARRGFKVVAFEPDPEGILTIPKEKNINAVRLAVGYPAGKREYYSYAPCSGANGFYLNEEMEKTYPSKKILVKTITLQDAIRSFGRPDLLKMNIEGSEVDIIMHTPDSILQSIPQMAISFHAFCGFVTQEQEIECQDRLRSLGFELSFHVDEGKGLPEGCNARRRK
ncbi:MAG: FkbM family methyltransferase [bacterium]